MSKTSFNLLPTILVLALALLGTGCRLSQPTVASFSDLPGSTDTVFLPPPVETPFRFHPYNTLVISFEDPSNTPTKIVIEDYVKEDGTLTLLSNRVFTAAGKERNELEKEIRGSYVPPFSTNLTVDILSGGGTGPHFCQILGQVRSPGRHVFYGKAITLLKAIELAGGFSSSANRKKVKLIRENWKCTVNCKEALGNPGRDTPVVAGDRIVVPRSFWK